jgi:alkylation response protein AidB-like acyl-CoA dehydrogenase
MTDLLLTEEEKILQSTVRDFADKVLAPRAAAYDQSGEFPADNVAGIAGLGLFGLGIDEAYGGSGGTARQGAIVVEELARGCAGTSTVYVAHQSLAAHYINMFGSDEHKQKYLPGMVTADTIAAFALTEPGAGSDAAGIQTTATRDGDDYVLNGSKIFITNAAEAGVLVVLASLDLSLRSKAFVALIVDGDTPGLTITPMHGKMGIRASSTCEVFFDNCRVPIANRMGDEYEGFKLTMDVLNASRIGIAAQAVGIAQAAYEEAVKYAKQREAFGKHLADHQGIQWMIADMATEVEAARLLVLQAATLRDQGMPFVTEASMAKLFASRVAVETADKAVQIHGGVGYFSPTTVERLYRDAKITEIYEGTSEVQRMIISRSVLAD